MGGLFTITVEVEDLDSEVLIVFEEEEANDGQDDWDDEKYCFQATKFDESTMFDFALSLELFFDFCVLEEVVWQGEVSLCGVRLTLCHKMMYSIGKNKIKTRGIL